MIKPMTKAMLTLLVSTFALCMNAEIVDGYSAPTNFQAYYINGQTTFWFEAPAEGGVVWASDFSYTNGLGDLRQIGDGDAWTNAGGGAEISTAAFYGVNFTNHASTLAIPAVSLSAGVNYELTFRSAGSRSSQNQQLNVMLYRGKTPIKTIMEAYELAPSLNYENKVANFSVEESGDDYEVRFVFIESEKNCGASLMNIVLSAPIPEGRGELKGYNLYRNEELMRYYEAAEAVRNQLYMELTDNSELDYSTQYTYALQAVYEGGESPLSNSASYTTGEDPLVNIVPIENREQKMERFDLAGRRTNSTSLIIIEGGKKIIK